MPVDERSRHALYLRLEQVLGHEEAATLMESLPSTGWSDVATKRDLEHLAEVNRQEHQALEHRLMAAFRKEFAAQTRTFTFALLGSFLTSTGVALALARAL
jgi:phytoene dehydrogenase-like protein